MKPSVAKKAISFVLLFGLSGVGVSAAHAESERLEEVKKSAPSATNKQHISQQDIQCWFDEARFVGYRQELVYDPRTGQQVYHNVPVYQKDGIKQDDELVWMTPLECDRAGGVR